LVEDSAACLYASFLEKDAILFSFGDTPCLERNGPCEPSRPNSAAGRKRQEQRKNKWKKYINKYIYIYIYYI
jgi:hypothetical protein